MEKIVDEHGVDITNDLRLIRMMETIEVTGGAGTKKFFVRMKQYRYDSIVYHYIKPGCRPCNDTSMKLHYRVKDENGEYFDVNEDYCQMDDKPRPIWEQGFTEYMDHISDQPKDVIQEYKDLTGIDLSDQNMPVTNGGDFIVQENERVRAEKQGKTYGTVEVRKEFPTD